MLFVLWFPAVRIAWLFLVFVILFAVSARFRCLGGGPRICIVWCQPMGYSRVSEHWRTVKIPTTYGNMTQDRLHVLWNSSVMVVRLQQLLWKTGCQRWNRWTQTGRNREKSSGRWLVARFFLILINCIIELSPSLFFLCNRWGTGRSAAICWRAFCGWTS